LDNRKVFQEAMFDSAKSLSGLLRVVDEYLVYVSMQKLYPTNFDVCTLMDQDDYEQHRTHLERLRLKNLVQVS